MLKRLSIAQYVRHLRRYQHIFSVFARHGFGFAISLLPAEPGWLRGAAPMPEARRLPVHFRLALEELGPTFVKLGQMLSTRPDLLPPDYIAELAKLQDEVPPVSWAEIREAIEEELGQPPEALFAHINPESMAAASLGQVHAARLHSGEEVVIKIQRPNIRPTLETDLQILQDLAHYAERYTALGQVYRLEEIAEDFADTLHNELNYRREGRNADRFRQNFARERYLYIPKVYWELTTERVLVLERIYGIKIDALGALDAAGHDRHKVASHAARMIIKEVLQDGFFHADPHPGNFLVMEDGVIAALDFGMTGYLSEEDRVNLIRIYAVAVRLDAHGVVDELVHIGAAPPDVERRALARDIEGLLRRYHSLSLQEIRAAEVLEEVMPIIFRYRLRLPSNLWLLGKTLAMLEGVGLKLDPAFDVFEFSEAHVSRLLLGSVLPNRRWLEGLMQRGLVWSDLFETLPRAALQLIERINQREPIPLSVDDRILNRADRLVTRLSLSLIISGMIVGLALVVPTLAQSHLILQVIVGLGFALSLGLGLWLLLSIVWKK